MAVSLTYYTRFLSVIISGMLLVARSHDREAETVYQ